MFGAAFCLALVTVMAPEIEDLSRGWGTAVSERVIPAAKRLVTENYPVRILDAIHIAVARHSTAALTAVEPVTFVTRDERQAEAAKANGSEVL